MPLDIIWILFFWRLVYVIGSTRINLFLSGGGVLAPPFLGLGSGLASPYGVGVGGVGLPAFGALTLTPASPALRALAAPPLPLATVLLVSNLNEEVRIS